MASIRGWAVVMRAQPLHANPDSATRPYQLSMEVHRDGAEPYSVTQKVTVRRGRWLGQGSVLAVDISERKPDKVNVDWHRTAVEEPPDSLRGRSVATQQPGADSESTLHRMLNGSDGSGPLPQSAAPSRSGRSEPGDRIGQLERLAALKESGALSAEEFEAEKRRLLGD